MTRRRILAAGWHTGAVNAISPVVKELRKRGENVKVAAYGVGAKAFKQNDVKVDVMLQRVTSHGVASLVEHEKPSIVLCGLSHADSEHPHVLEQEMVLAARVRGIRSVAVLDYWNKYLERVSELDVSVTPPAIKTPFRYMPDVICILDIFTREKMDGLGFDSSALIITGNPYFSELAEKLGNLPSPSADNKLLFCSKNVEAQFGDSLGYTEKSALLAVYRVLSELSNEHGGLYELLVRKHPRESDIDMGQFVHPGVAVALDSNPDIHESLAASNVILGPYTTALVEARIMGKPAISVQPGRYMGAPEFQITNELDITTLTRTDAELKAVLGAALSGSLSQNEILVPEDSAERVIQQLY